MMARAILLLAAIAASSCLHPTAPDAAVGKSFELKAGAIATLPDGSRFKFNSVSDDSRCPMDANCVWAGDATVGISLSRPGSANEARELHLQSSGASISYGGYVIELTALAPYPKVNRQIGASDYVATFTLHTP
jgi:hypothetical protein